MSDVFAISKKKSFYNIRTQPNLAARMEQNSEAGKVNISGNTYELVKDKFTSSVRQGGQLLQEEKGSGKFIFTHRGKIQAKNKGEIDMYFVETT